MTLSLIRRLTKYLPSLRTPKTLDTMKNDPSKPSDATTESSPSSYSSLLRQLTLDKLIERWREGPPYRPQLIGIPSPIIIRKKSPTCGSGTLVLYFYEVKGRIVDIGIKMYGCSVVTQGAAYHMVDYFLDHEVEEVLAIELTKEDIPEDLKGRKDCLLFPLVTLHEAATTAKQKRTRGEDSR